jgi:hypothetical protein
MMSGQVGIIERAAPHSLHCCQVGKTCPLHPQPKEPVALQSAGLQNCLCYRFPASVRLFLGLSHGKGPRDAGYRIAEECPHRQGHSAVGFAYRSGASTLSQYQLALAACIVAMVPCSCGCFLGLPIGVWGLVLLMQDDVKKAFG